jgi:hypothetical protein
MTKVMFGNHSAVMVPRQKRDSIRKFYCDVLGGLPQSQATLRPVVPQRPFACLNSQ